VSPEIVTIIALTVVFAIATVLLAHLIIAPSVASIIVDVSPFATNGALVLADAQDVDRTPSASRSSVTPRSSSPWGRCLPDWCSSSSPLL
jgi:hypothetical protein